MGENKRHNKREGTTKDKKVGEMEREVARDRVNKKNELKVRENQLK